MVGEKARPTLILAMKNINMLLSDHSVSSPSATSSDGDDYTDRSSNLSACPSDCLSPDTVLMSPWNQTSNLCSITPRKATIVGSILRQDGHVYSVAAKGGLLYTGSDRKKIRVWKNMQESNGFKSSSAFVKAIVMSGDKVFTGHQDGKIRVWTNKGGGAHTQIGTLPTLLDVITASMRRKSYVKVRPNRIALWVKHADAISCLSMDEESGLLYSASWDRTFKVWKVDNSKCVESVNAHNDAVNAVAAGGGGMVYTGSADGALRVWKREPDGKHSLSQTLLSLDCAITALAVGASGSVVYCGSSDGLVNFWEVGKQLSHGGVLKGHKLAVLCLAAAGNLVFSGSADKTICAWRREGVVHTCLTVMLGHTGPVKCLAVEEEKEADGGRRRWKLYSGSLDKSVKVWSLSETPSE